MKIFICSLRIVLGTWAICVIGYGGLILAIGQGVTPHTADGSLLENGDGQIVGSRQIAQSFAQPAYFWPRLSAVDYDGAGAGGSNLAPTSPVISERAQPVLAALGATSERPAPADLVTASGSGLDPHISLEAALYQAPRVAEARSGEVSAVEALIDSLAFSSGGALTEGRIVNVLELNLLLDRKLPKS
jgi:K+-transporting ATPase ATPase C chain